jgi:CDP-glycerol:poly(glycerophosphate) glycerophosphotransferase
VGFSHNRTRTAGPLGFRPGEGAPGEVVVYFGDDPRRLYQLRQWLPVFERLHARHPVLLVTRDPRTYTDLHHRTALPRVLAPAFPDLVDLYDNSDHKVAIYVNNSAQNFQSLVGRRMLHVHVNHGESDKICMVSNQVKAYDRVFVAGEAAVRRYRAGLIDFDTSRLVRVGRPQLDLRPTPVLAPTSRRTILYAPTWEGENSSNNYTSIDRYGAAVLSAALAVPDVRVVYKPHPRVATSADPVISAAHRHLVELLDEQDPGAGHRVMTEADIFAVFPGCDLMITDVSSVGLDFLYLHPDKPLFITDRHDDRDRLHTDAPVSRCADVVDSATVGVLAHLFAARLSRDDHRPGREAMRRYYFDNLGRGESTERFLAAVEEIMSVRDRLMGQAETRVSALVPDEAREQVA